MQALYAENHEILREKLTTYLKEVTPGPRAEDTE